MAMRLLTSPRVLNGSALPVVASRCKHHQTGLDSRRAAHSSSAELLRRAAVASDADLSDAEDTIMNNYAAALADLPSKYRVLVLDSSYRPIEIINWKRAICLDLFDKVDVLEYYDMYVRSAYAEHFIPAVCRVRMYIKSLSKASVTVSRRNIILRDRNTCQYCGSRTNYLTIDHVVPKHAGGLWEWENLVAACSECNAKKGSKSLKQLKWALKNQPRRPSAFELGAQLGADFNMSSAPKEWASYLYQ